MYAKLVKAQGREEVEPAYLFPSYIFVKPRDDQWAFLLNTFGVTSVLMMGGEPANMPEKKMEQLKALQIDGLIPVPKRKECTKHHSRFVLGQTVRVKGGSFSGYIGIHQGSSVKDRERVLLDFLGRKTSVLIGDQLLEAA
jgi:transcription antitermination factor NusG